MSSPERSPKRRRTSWSPASPPLQESKVFPEGQSLHTPPPSVHMSPSWQSQSLPTTSSTSTSTTIPTPPSTASYPSQLHKSMEGGDSMAETPKERGRDGEGDVEMEDADHRRTDHERLDKEDVSPAPLLYKLDTKPVEASSPDCAQDLLGLYSLRAVQASVARRDPKTGEKINKLRKSYETKSRNLGIEGRNKATVQEGHLQGLVDPLWDSLVSEGLTMWEQKMENFVIGGTGTDQLIESLATVYQLKPGHLPKAEHIEWTQQLGLDEPVLQRPMPGGLIPSKSMNNLLLSRTNPMAAGRATAPASPSGLRPDRSGKKRRYDESSYEGYDDDGYSTGGIDDAGRRINAAKRLKQRKGLAA